MLLSLPLGSPWLTVSVKHTSVFTHTDPPYTFFSFPDHASYPSQSSCDNSSEILYFTHDLLDSKHFRK